MKCCNLCNGTIGMLSDDICEFCIADIQYIDLSYSEFA